MLWRTTSPSIDEVCRTRRNRRYSLGPNRVRRSLNERLDLLDLFWFQLAGEIGHAAFDVGTLEHELRGQVRSIYSGLHLFLVADYLLAHLVQSHGDYRGPCS